MFQKFNLNQKLYIGFGFIFLFLIILAMISTIGLRGTVGNAKEVIEGNRIKENITEKHVDHLIWSMKVSTFLINDDINELEVETNPNKCAFGKWYYSAERKKAERFIPELKITFNEIEKYHNELHESANLIIGDYKISKNKAENTYVNRTLPALEKIDILLNKIVDLTDSNLLTDDSMISEAERTSYIIIVLSGLTIVVGILFSIFITVGISKTINKITMEIGSGANQVAAASMQLSSSSQQMAEGANKQASSLEEISSSINELTSLTKQNADNSHQANEMGRSINTAGDNSKQAVEKMNTTVEQIKESSDRTAQIIKTIDEIAMQTNLLALNAAVEAARAGDAGKGFAVVAEEVRNLAQRSAEAAKSTAELIEGMQRSSEEGVIASEEVSKTINEISDSVKKMTGLLDEVSVASGEQTQGLDQISTAVLNLDKVTQSNAANSEQSASSSEELSAQAQGLNMAVESLKSIIGNKKINELRNENLKIDRRIKHHNDGSFTKNKMIVEIKPNDQISLDNEKDLKEF